MIRDLFRDIAKYLPSHVIPAMVGIISVPIITRLISPAEYGNYSLVLAGIFFLSTFATTWLSASVVRHYPTFERDDRLDEFHCLVVKLSGTMSGSVFFAAWFVLFFSRKIIPLNYYDLMHIGLFVFLLQSIFDLLQGLLRAKRMPGWFSFFTVWQRVAGLSLGILMIVCFHRRVEGLFYGSFLSVAIALPLLYKLAVGKIDLKQGKLFSPMTRTISTYGFPLIIVNLAGWTAVFSDRYIISFFRDAQEVGIYSVGYSIAQQSIQIIVTLFSMASNPIAFSTWETQGDKESRVLLSEICRYYLLFAVPATIGLSVLSKPVMRILAAPSYFSGYEVIPLIAFSLFTIGIIDRFSTVLTFHKRTNLIMYCIIVCAILNLALNLFLIPKYGYMAAALTTFLAFAAEMIMVIVISRRFLVWRFPYKSLLKTSLSAVLMGAGVLLISSSVDDPNLFSLIGMVCSGIGIYLVMLIVFREIRIEEIKKACSLFSF